MEPLAFARFGIDEEHGAECAVAVEGVRGVGAHNQALAELPGFGSAADGHFAFEGDDDLDGVVAMEGDEARGAGDKEEAAFPEIPARFAEPAVGFRGWLRWHFWQVWHSHNFSRYVQALWRQLALLWGVTRIQTRVERDNLSFAAPPLLLTAITAWLMWALSREAPDLDLGLGGASLTSMGLAVLGVFVCLAGVVSFRRAGTTVNPMRPDKASALVVSGVYKVSRNPMYLGFLLVLVGWGVFVSNLLALPLLLGFVIYLNRFQIGPEEEALRASFGVRYEMYEAKVRRWI